MIGSWFRLLVFGSLTAILMPVQALSVFFKWPARRWIPVKYHRTLCALLGIRVKIIGTCAQRRPLLIVANHSSWLDIVVISSAAPVVFVAKSEVASWPFFGLCAKLQRSIFVDRRRRHKTVEVNAEIAQRLLDGDPVVLFGEGTSSDGNRVLPFRTALIGAAHAALSSANIGHVTVQPLSLVYVGRHGLPFNRVERRALAWYGGIDLWPHLMKVLRRGAIDAILTWGEPVAYNADSDRKQMAVAMETAVRRNAAAARRGQVRLQA
jgi:lyso-ornithine lipid O-acyltransferase